MKMVERVEDGWKGWGWLEGRGMVGRGGDGWRVGSDQRPRTGGEHREIKCQNLSRRGK